MRITIPDPLDTSATTTNLTVEDPGDEWDPDKTGGYAIEDVVWKASTHRKYKSAVDSNEDDPSVGVTKSPKTWVDIGPTNEWAFKDQINGTQTVNDDTLEITHSIVNPAYLTSVSLFNLEASEVRVAISSSQAGGSIHDVTYSLENFSNINDLYDARYAPFISPVRDLAVSGWKEYSDSVVTVTVRNVGSVAKLGNLVVGETLSIGDTLSDFTTPILDYSRRIVDDYGNTTLKNYGNSKQFRGQVAIPIEQVNTVYQALSDLASVPVAFVGDERYVGSIVYGTVSIIPAYDVTDVSIATVKVEGLK